MESINNIEKIKNFNIKLKRIVSPELFNEACDEFFRYDYMPIESSLQNLASPTHLYLDEALEEEALNTSWYDYFQLINLAQARNKKLLDIGSGYSKGTLLALTLGFDNITSIEIVPQRISWARETALRLGLPERGFITGDSLLQDLSHYDTFFLYQPVGEFLSRILQKITKLADREIWAIESHGDLIHRLDFDSRLDSKNNELFFSAARHNRELYSFKVKPGPYCQYLDFEEALYSSQYIRINDSNPVYGDFTWIASTREAFIDFINERPTLDINGTRISIEENLDNLILTKPKSSFELKYLEVNRLVYKNIDQRILKVIIQPKYALELSSSGIVLEEYLLKRPSSY